MESNYYNRDPEDNKSYQKTVVMCVAAASMVILLFLVILYVNSDRGSDKVKPATAKVEEETEEKDDILKDSHNITSDELEFWEDAAKPTPAVEEEEGELTPYKDPDSEDEDAYQTNDKTKDRNDNRTRSKTGDPNDTDDTYVGVDNEDTDNVSGTKEKSSKTRRDGLNDEDTGETGRKDDTGRDDNRRDDGNIDEYGDGYIAITDDNGRKKYYEILSDVPKNDYDFENDLINENGVLTYKNNRRESIKGVDLSKYNGSVDFNKLKENGVGFAMLRLGSRGYGTGKISLDERFVEYAQNAQLAGIQIGAYFYSQAINENEAVEEANYIVGAVSGFNVKYPIAIDVEHVSGDEARTDKLTSEERTAIVKSFCDTVKGFGYKPVIYATKDMLVAGLDLEDLTDYDVWLSDDSVPTDYPYRFSMWQYNRRGHIDGITGDIDFDMSFIDYEQK